MTPLQLGPTELVAGRPFSDPQRTADDLAVLRGMRVSVRKLAGLPEPPPERWDDGDGVRHWLEVPDWERLHTARPVCAVGFFGQARELDHRPIVRLEENIVARAAGFDGLLAYYDVGFPGGHFGNLVLFVEAAAKKHVRTDPAHLEAVALTPRHYSSLRLHHGHMADGVLGDAELELERTRYMAFDGDAAWHAVREPALP